MRATTLKASPADVGGLLAYYAGLAHDQVRRDRLGRGPMTTTSTRPSLPAGVGVTAPRLSGSAPRCGAEQLAGGLLDRRPAANPPPLL